VGAWSGGAANKACRRSLDPCVRRRQPMSASTLHLPLLAPPALKASEKEHI